MYFIRLLPFFSALWFAPVLARAEGAPPGKVLVEAGEIAGDAKTVRAAGGVRACFGDYVLDAAAMEYDREGDLLRAPGAFELSAPQWGNTVSGEELLYRPRLQTGEASGVRIFVGEGGLRADGETAYFADGEFSADNVEISSCKPESRDWVLRADSIKQGESGILARNAWLHAGGVPAFYLPAVWVNTAEEKQSGFLPPEAEYSGGGRIRLPYYFFLADNYDATFTPEWLGGHGLLLGGEFRYLMQNYGGDAQLSWNPKEGRGRQQIAHEWRAGHWRFNIDADNVSDHAYFADFSDDSALLAARNLPRRFSAHYARGDWSGGAVAESIKTLNYAGAAPHDRLPQLYLRRDGGQDGVFWHSEWEWTRFVAPSAAQPEGGRWLWRGAARRRFDIGAAEITPEAGMHAAKYSGGAAFWTPFARVLAESAYYPLPRGGNYRLRAVYAYAPETNQQNAPVYDSALRELSVGGIYNWNRFSGGDRASDANFAAYGGEIRFWDADAGRESAALEIAQRYYFRRPRLTLPDETAPPERGFANLLAELKIKTGVWKAESNAEWSPANNSFESVYADVRADFGGKLLRAGGLFEEEESIIAGGAFPLGARAEFGFLLRYILDDDQLAESDAALALRGECGCWRFYLRGKRLITAEVRDRTTYSFGLELTGLGRMGGNAYDKIISDLR